jgi:hypothetical protein
LVGAKDFFEGEIDLGTNEGFLGYHNVPPYFIGAAIPVGLIGVMQGLPSLIEFVRSHPFRPATPGLLVF